MARARRADVDHVLGERLQHRLQLRERGLAGADHHVELAKLGLDRGARERRVDEGHFFRRGKFAQARRRVGFAGRAIDDDETGPRAGQQAALADHARLDLRRAGDADEDDVALARERGR